MGTKALWAIGIAAGLAGITLPASAASLQGRCTWVSDGAHLGVQVGHRVEHVTLIGVDVANVGPCGSRGTAFARALALGKSVRVVPGRVARDRTGALLAYVYLPDGTFVNERIVANGYARVGNIGDNTEHAGELMAAQNLARNHNTCVWVGQAPRQTHTAGTARHWQSPVTIRPHPPGGGGGGVPKQPTPPRWRNPPHWPGPRTQPAPKPHPAHEP